MRMDGSGMIWMQGDFYLIIIHGNFKKDKKDGFKTNKETLISSNLPKIQLN